MNNSIITGNDGKVSGKNITNNDLIAFDNYLEMNAQGKVQNNKGKAIYGGKNLVRLPMATTWPVPARCGGPPA